MTPCPSYEEIGVKVNGRYEQLNANILQIENEYYSTVRPKQLLQDDEMPTNALEARGVRYVELRSLDVNPYAPLGVELDQVGGIVEKSSGGAAYLCNVQLSQTFPQGIDSGRSLEKDTECLGQDVENFPR